jgi:uncharacterized protein (TIGR03118 family)
MTTGDSSAVWSRGTQRSSHETKSRGSYRFRAATVAIVMASTALAGTSATAGTPAHEKGNTFKQVNLVSDLDTIGAELVDLDVVNPWGIAMGPTSPLWVNNMRFSPDDKITLYKGATKAGDRIEKLKLVVKASAPTGMVFNPTSSFKVKQDGVKAPATFLFNENVLGETSATAKVTGWSNDTNPTSTVTKATKQDAIHTGLALVPGKSKKPGKDGPLLLAADNINRTIDIYDGNFKKLHRTGALKGAFVDPNTKKDNIPPYNVTFLKDRVYVAYFDFNLVTPGSAISVFTPKGKFIKRLVKANQPGNPLAAPWGMAIAPNNWGRFGGAILVGNVLSGEIQAFNRRNGHLLGTLKGPDKKPLVNGGLWGLAFGNGTIGTPRTLIFAAGIGNDPRDLNLERLYSHGLVGLIKPVNDKH